MNNHDFSQKQGVGGQNKATGGGFPEKPGHPTILVLHLPFRLPDHIPTLQIASFFTLPQGEILSAREVN